MLSDDSDGIGYLSDPPQINTLTLHDDLAVEARDHWWVEAYLPTTQDWRNLDPSFPESVIGQQFVNESNVATDGTDRVAELPDASRHKVSIQLKVERAFPLFGAFGFSFFYPLSLTFSSVELSANPLALNHIIEVESTSSQYIDITTIQYQPYIMLGEKVFVGSEYQDVIPTFGNGAFSSLNTAAWLEYKVTDPDGSFITSTREIVDRIGHSTRVFGGNLQINSELKPLWNQADAIVTWFWSSDIPQAVLDEWSDEIKQKLPTLISRVQFIQENQNPQRDSAKRQKFNESIGDAFLFIKQMLAFGGLRYGQLATESFNELASAYHVKVYIDSPQIVALSAQTLISESLVSPVFGIDLRRTVVDPENPTGKAGE
jgi:hypothetical protein